MSLAPREYVVPGHGMEVLVVCSDHADLESLVNALHGTPWQTRVARSCTEAIAAAATNAFGAVICGQQLEDGTWKDVLAAPHLRLPATRLIVFSRLADKRLWADVLHLGGYDLLQTPFDSREVRTAVGSTCLSPARPARPDGGPVEADYGARVAEFEAKVRQLSAAVDQLSRRLASQPRAGAGR